jgi:AraC-like DNA-binding protein
MLIHYKKPEGILADFIDHYWEKKMESAEDIPYEVETIFPEDQVVITFSLGNVFYRAVQNPTDFLPINGSLIESLHTLPTYYKHQVGNHIFGIKFKLGGLACFSTESFKNFNNTNCSIDKFLIPPPQNFHSLLLRSNSFEDRVQLFEDYFSPLLIQTKIKKWERMNHFVEILKSDQDINAALYKTITRSFIELTGITPKDYLQIKRINQSLAYFAQNKSSKNQELAELLGFYDTAHFNHTFKKFTGKTPQTFVHEIEQMQPNEFIEEFKQYISPEHLLYYSSKKHT